MVKDQQVRRLVKLRKNEKTLTRRRRKRGCHKYLKSGKLPSQCQPSGIGELDRIRSSRCGRSLKRSPMEATTVFEYLCRQQEGAFHHH